MRKLSSWLGGYLEYIDGIVAPDVMKVWSGLALIAAGLGRRVHTRIQKQDCFPNLYTLFVGPPGIGKSNSALEALKLARKVPSIRLAPEGLTKRALLMELEAAQTMASSTNPLEGMHCTLFALVEEMQILVPPLDKDFMVALARLYDCRDVFDYKTAHVGEHHIERACFNLLACCTRTYLKESWSNLTLEAGLPARIIIVYSEERVHKEVFEVDEKDEGVRKVLQDRLVYDLEQITKLNGMYHWDLDAQKHLADWYKAEMPPKPGDPRLEHYNGRRLAHVVKLCQIVAASKGDELIITLEDLASAKELLFMAEATMPGALEILGANPLVAEMTLATKLIKIFWTKNHSSMPEHKLRQILYREIHPQYINTVLEGLTLAREILVDGKAGSRMFSPKPDGGNE